MDVQTDNFLTQLIERVAALSMPQLLLLVAAFILVILVPNLVIQRAKRESPVVREKLEGVQRTMLFFPEPLKKVHKMLIGTSIVGGFALMVLALNI